MPVEYLQHYHDAIARAKPIELQRHYAIGEALWTLERDFAAGAITKATRDKQARALHAEEAPAVITFETEKAFAAFCAGRKALHEQFLHEQEHAEVYRKYTIPYVFGFVKIISQGEIGLIPWIHPRWPQGMSTRDQLKITIESLENASEHSQGDLQDIRALKHLAQTLDNSK